MLTTARIQKSVLTLTMSGCLYLLSTTSGLAGFEWVPVERTATPPAAPQQQQNMVVEQAPVAPVSGETLQPAQPNMAVNAGTAPQPEILMVPSNVQQPAPQPMPAPMAAPAPMPAPEAPMETVMTPSPFDAPPVSAPQPALMQTITPSAPAPQPMPTQMAAPVPMAAPAPMAAPVPQQAPIALQPSVPVQQQPMATSIAATAPTPVAEPEDKRSPFQRIKSFFTDDTPAEETATAQPIIRNIAEEPAMQPVSPQPLSAPPVMAEMPAPAIEMSAPIMPEMSSATETPAVVTPTAEIPELNVAPKTITPEQAKMMAAQQLEGNVTPTAAMTSAEEIVPTADLAPMPLETTPSDKAMAQDVIENLALAPEPAIEPENNSGSEILAPIMPETTVTAEPQIEAEIPLEPEYPVQSAAVQPAPENMEIIRVPDNIPDQPAPSAPPIAITSAEQIVPSINSDEPYAPVDTMAATDPEMDALTEMSNVYAGETQTSGAYETISGFGKDIPLALAVQQVVPQGYATSFAKSVNPGLRVSWDGERSWDVILKEMLQPVGLKATISGNTVSVVSTADIGTTQPQRNIPTLDVVNPDDFNTTLEPASGTDEGINSNAIMTPVEPVSLQVDGQEPVQSKRMIKDPGENPSEQPNLLVPMEIGSDNAALEDVPAENNMNAAIEDQILQPQSTRTNIDESTGLTIHQASIDTTSGETIITPFSENEAVKSLNQETSWSAEKGQSLKKVLYGWSQKANIQIVWEASHDYTLKNDIAVGGTAEEAIDALFAASTGEEATPKFRFIEDQRNSGKTALVIVQDQPDATASVTDAPAVQENAEEEALSEKAPS